MKTSRSSRTTGRQSGRPQAEKVKVKKVVECWKGPKRQLKFTLETIPFKFGSSRRTRKKFKKKKKKEKLTFSFSMIFPGEKFPALAAQNGGRFPVLIPCRFKEKAADFHPLRKYRKKKGCLIRIKLLPLAATMTTMAVPYPKFLLLLLFEFNKWYFATLNLLRASEWRRIKSFSLLSVKITQNIRKIQFRSCYISSGGWRRGVGRKQKNVWIE